jgi:hypothetical protein
MKAGERSEEDRAGMKLCFYSPVAEDSQRFLQVTISQPGLDPAGRSSPATTFHAIREAMESGRRDLEDLGDGAFIATGGLYVLAGDCVISVGSGNTSLPETQVRLRAAGEIALRRLADRR